MEHPEYLHHFARSQPFQVWWMVASWMGCFYHGWMPCFYRVIMEARHLSRTQPLLLGSLSWRWHCLPPGIPRAESWEPSSLHVWALPSLHWGCPAPAVLLCHLFPFHPLFFILPSSYPFLLQADISS